MLIVHHPGKDDARGMRGSTALFAACDTVIKIAPGDGGIRHVSIEKAKDGEAGPLLAYRLRQVQRGTDEEGDPITSCVVEADEATAAAPAKPKKRLNPTAKRALEMLRRLYNEGKGRDIEPEAINLAGVTERERPKVVMLDELRTKCYEARLAPDGEQAAQRQAFYRAMKELEGVGKLARYGDYVWLLGQQRAEPASQPERGSVTKRDKTQFVTLDGHAETAAHPSVTWRDMSRAGGRRDMCDSPLGGVTDVTLSPGQPEE